MGWTQCLEPFVSPGANPVTDVFAREGTDVFAREGLTRASARLLDAYRDGTDIRARTDMNLCSLFGGLSLANAKLGAVQGGGCVGGTSVLAHGLVCAALLSPVVEVNLRAKRQRDPEPRNPALVRHRQAARLPTGRADATAADVARWIRRLDESMDVPTLRAAGVGDEQLNDVVSAARRSSSMAGDPVQLTEKELREALDAAM